MLKITLITSLIFSFSPYQLASEEEKTLQLGTRSCKLLTTGDRQNNAIFLSLHDDENTSVEAFYEVYEKIDKAFLIELNQSGSRFIKYGYKGSDFLIDPNRIFTEKGLTNTLKKNNKSFPSEIIEPLKKFSDELLDEILPKDKDKYIVAIHNNSNENYSAKTYVGSNDAEKTYVNPNEDVDDFFFVTNNSDFEFFKSKKRNVILQSKKVQDDGSLSVYCDKHNYPYINIEAQDGHKETQKLMIKEAYSLIKSKQK
jgi:hypothetical protein